MMASEEQAMEQVDGEEGAEEQGLQEVKEIPHATPIAAGMQPPYDEDFNPFSEAGMQVEKILFLSLSLSLSLPLSLPPFRRRDRRLDGNRDRVTRDIYL